MATSPADSLRSHLKTIETHRDDNLVVDVQGVRYTALQGEVDPTSAEEKQRLKEEAKKLRLQGQNPDEAPDGDFMSEAKVYNSIDLKTRSDQIFQFIICSSLSPSPSSTFSSTYHLPCHQSIFNWFNFCSRKLFIIKIKS